MTSCSNSFGWIPVVAAVTLVATPVAAFSSLQTESAPTIAQEPPAPKFLPPLEEIARRDEQALLNELSTRMTAATSPDLALSALNHALVKLREPTELRGYVQFTRAGLLVMDGKYAPAIDAIEESIRLLSGYSGPLITAASVYTFANQPGKGADFLLRAMDIDPVSVSTLDDYQVMNLMRRLRFSRDQRRVSAVSDRLLEIGWVGSSLEMRSSLALEAIKRRIRQDDITGARALVPKLLVPAHSYELLANNDYREIWGDIGKWSGPKLERQWSIYLTEAHARWAASKDVSTVQDFSRALLLAGHDERVIREILPVFSRKLEEDRDQDLVFVVSGVANALGREGGWGKVDALFERLDAVWPLGSGAIALNITANWGRVLLLAGRHEEALSKLDEAISDSRRWGPEVNPDALAAMHHYRACALHELGRQAEAGVSLALAAAVEDPADLAALHLCVGNSEAAHAVLIEGLKHEGTRDGVIAFVQKSAHPPAKSDFGRKLHGRTEGFKSDPVLLAAVAKHGRVLPFKLNEAAPPESP